MQRVSSISKLGGRRKQKAAERTGIGLLRYIMDHPKATCRTASEDLGMSFPNVCRLVSDYKNLGIIVSGEQKQTGRRGPWSQIVMLRPELGCSIGVDLEATQVRGVVLDFANEVVGAARHSLSANEGPEDIVRAVVSVADTLKGVAAEWNLPVTAIGLALPGPVVDEERGRIRTELQYGETDIEFSSAVEEVCGLHPIVVPNSYCLAAGHHRMNSPRNTDVEVVIVNRFGIAAALIWNGNIHTGASLYAGDIGMLACAGTSSQRYQDVCTGAALLRLARSRGDERSLTELTESSRDPLLKEWFETAVPAMAQAIFSAIIAYDPAQVLLEGIFRKFPKIVQQRIIALAIDEVKKIGCNPPKITISTADDLMGARGAAMLARDQAVDCVLTEILRAANSDAEPFEPDTN